MNQTLEKKRNMTSLPPQRQPKEGEVPSNINSNNDSSLNNQKLTPQQQQQQQQQHQGSLVPSSQRPISGGASGSSPINNPKKRESTELGERAPLVQQPSGISSSSSIGRFQVTDVKTVHEVSSTTTTHPSPTPTKKITSKAIVAPSTSNGSSSSSSNARIPPPHTGSRTPNAPTPGVPLSVATRSNTTTATQYKIHSSSGSSSTATNTTSTPGSVTSTPSSTDNLAHFATTPSNITTTTGSGTAELRSLSSQVKLLTETSAKQMKILNALYALMQQSSSVSSARTIPTASPTGAGTTTTTKDNILSLLDQLQLRLGGLMEENKRVKEENTQLRIELDRYRKAAATTQAQQQQPALSRGDGARVLSSPLVNPPSLK